MQLPNVAVPDAETRLAHDGESAMKTALDYRPNVVLLDIGLPVIDGLKVAHWVRQQTLLKDVVPVALTGYGQDADRQRSREAGLLSLGQARGLAQIESILTAVASTSDLCRGSWQKSNVRHRTDKRQLLGHNTVYELLLTALEP